ncbi:subtilisin-like protein [Aulographum hederae CBS 113979]|uniref:tripeptidyl-peptidase II n=1 Tax=Aulographum hederae CBS 113979 TaxID=1176131 RepID=A0A6G1HGF1_9PEZI|nr:subtilisin-like protein [Aulographum hederae CBS 113979]
MRVSSFLALAALVASAVSSPATPYVVHEKRTSIPTPWQKRDRLSGETKMPLRIGLRQRNMEHTARFLKEVSDPKSPNYGKHWSQEKVAETFAPSDDTIQRVRNWLTASGVEEDRISLTKGKNWIHVKSTVDEAERLLKTQYYIYEHDESGQPHVGCDKYYSLPYDVSPHVDLVMPTLHFDAKVMSREQYLTKRSDRIPITPGKPKEKSIGKGYHRVSPKQGATLASGALADDLALCDQQIVPACLRSLYNIPESNSTTSAANNSYGIVEYTPQAYLPEDLDMFFANFSPKLVGARPTFQSIDGGVLQTDQVDFSYMGESDLDLEYAMVLSYPQNVTLYQVGDTVNGASFNNFLDAIDGSYCEYEGGDDLQQDPQYPDTSGAEGAYTGPKDCGTFEPAKVISTSYGYDEVALTAPYEERQCEEYAKLGLQGVSILYSSGDYGVAGNYGQCVDSDSGSLFYNDGTSGSFVPGFPATCPFVTAVGATQVIPGTNIAEARASGTQPEKACETRIYSGAGFSNVFPMPDYQAETVKGWWDKGLAGTYTEKQFNNSQSTRGLPDISANGANYVVAVVGEYNLVYGTSASSPVFGAMITKINDARLEAGKASLGFLNPSFYANPAMFRDVVEGSAPGCGTDGFAAVEGWDPVTGLGTPEFPAMLEYYMGLD